MTGFLRQFQVRIEKEDKAGSLELVMSWLEKGEIDVPTLYNDVLAPAMNHMFSDQDPRELVVWREHVRSSIVRTIIENCTRYVVATAAPPNGKKVVVICPPEELHELGPRMVSDFFTLAGYDVTFVGANTPVEDFLAVVRYVKPDYVALSVTNHYNLLAAKRAVKRIREEVGGVTIVVGGRAFAQNPKAFKEVGADRLVQTYDEITKLEGGG